MFLTLASVNNEILTKYYRQGRSNSSAGLDTDSFALQTALYLFFVANTP